jgi:hypothetical protein
MKALIAIYTIITIWRHVCLALADYGNLDKGI